MATSVIVNGARTPIGRLMGQLGSLPATDLGAIAIASALERSGISAGQVQYVIMGQVLQAGAGQMPARQAASNAGISMSVPALSINKVCLSGLDAIALADQLIRAGEFDIVVAGGMESMSKAPHLLYARDGVKFGSVEVLDSMALDGLTDTLDHVPMGESTDRFAAAAGISRSEQDAYAVASHERAARAQKNGLLAQEITPVSVPHRRDAAVDVTDDEGIRPDASADALARLAPAFSTDGTITAGTSSQISDGAAAVVVARKSTAIDLGLNWIAEVGSHGNVAGPDNSLLPQPASAIHDALRKDGRSVADLDLVEVNEAFAAVVIHTMRSLDVPHDIVNVNGGAIALGHPIGMSGARLVLTLALELGRRGGGFGAAALCGGGGQGDALLLQVPSPGDDG
jgi:acetyl-CoA C-acetyltransferase